MHKLTIKNLNKLCKNGFMFDETLYKQTGGTVQSFIKPFICYTGNTCNRYYCVLQYENTARDGVWWYTLGIYNIGKQCLAQIAGTSGKTRKDMRTLANLTSMVDDSYLSMVWRTKATSCNARNW